MKICSACLIGMECRYDGKDNLSKASDRLIKEYKKGEIIPVCPEQMGGLPTPRIPCEIKNYRVFNREGEETTKYFEKGAREVMKIVEDLGIEEAIMKQGSPSCGCGQIYSGDFSGEKIEGDGITTRVLKKNGVKIFSENDYL